MIPLHIADVALTNSVTRTVQQRPCVCGAWTLRGLDDPRCAGEATVAPQPLDAVGELLARAGGRNTYNLHLEAGRLILDHRSQWAIRSKPPGIGAYDVVAEHRCHAPPLPGIPSRLPTQTPDQENSDDRIPF